MWERKKRKKKRIEKTRDVMDNVMEREKRNIKREWCVCKRTVRERDMRKSELSKKCVSVLILHTPVNPSNQK